MNSVQNIIQHTLINKREEFLRLWTPRLRGLLPPSLSGDVDALAEFWRQVLVDYYSHEDTDGIVGRLQINAAASPHVFNAISISRYALLALMPGDNSLEWFSRLNDAYEPLLRAIHKMENSSTTFSEWAPSDFSRAFERYFENILRDAADAIILLDAKDHIVMWNKAAEAIYGWSRQEMLGQHISRIVPQDAESRREIEWINQEVRSRGYVRNFRTHRLTRDGKPVTIAVTRTAIYGEKNEFIGSSVISRDLTEQEKLRDQLVHSEKLSAVGTLAAGIAHEIGSPLTAISSISQLLKVKSKDPYFTEKVGLIQESIDRIARIVRTLVDFSKPIQAKIERIYINSVIEDVIHIVKYDRRLKYRKIETQLQADVPQLKASFDQLLQVFINLCLNAADAMEDVPEGLLLIKTWSDGDEVLTSVSDNGCGIQPDHLPHIFEPFFTTKGDRQGTGLGLWVSYNIIKSFSGDIQVESTPHVGTTFTISLPALKSSRA